MRRGLTLVEVIVSAFVSLLLLTVIFSVYYVSQHSYTHASQGYGLGLETQTALRTLRTDLRATSLVSIVTYPNPLHPSEPPGLSFASSTSASQPRQTMYTASGAPLWVKHVFYTVVDHRLLRWEQPLLTPALAPAATAVLPSARQNPQSEMFILYDVLGPHLQVGTLLPDSGEYGGFQVSFLRLPAPGGVDYQLSPDNPTSRSDADTPDWSKGSTSLIQIDLRTLSTTPTTGKQNYLAFKIRISPRS